LIILITCANTNNRKAQPAARATTVIITEVLLRPRPFLINSGTVPYS
jgi:hypothetical protein